MKRIITLLFLSLAASGCTEQARARRFGGTVDLQVAPGEKVIGATWKGDGAALWILTRPAKEGEQPETLRLRESSSWGVIEGTVVLHEQPAVSTSGAQVTVRVSR